MSFAEWAEQAGVKPGRHSDLRMWLNDHPEVVKDILEAVNSGYAWKYAQAYVEKMGGPKAHFDTLRRLLADV